MKKAEAPGVVKIAVCGPRRLNDPARLTGSVLAAADRIRSIFPGSHFELLTCLAEGADRLLAKHLVSALPADLTLVLPLLEEDYLDDFHSSQSLEEYKGLRLLACRVMGATENLPRPLAYQAANRTLVEACDLLVAIWDGMPARGPGGTAEGVEKWPAWRAGRCCGSTLARGQILGVSQKSAFVPTLSVLPVWFYQLNNPACL